MEGKKELKKVRHLCEQQERRSFSLLLLLLLLRLSVVRQEAPAYKGKEREKRDSPLWHQHASLYMKRRKEEIYKALAPFIFLEAVIITPEESLYEFLGEREREREREGDECINALHSTTTSSYPKRKKENLCETGKRIK